MCRLSTTWLNISQSAYITIFVDIVDFITCLQGHMHMFVILDVFFIDITNMMIVFDFFCHEYDDNFESLSYIDMTSMMIILKSYCTLI